MGELLWEKALVHGEKIQIIHLERLHNIQKEIALFQDREDLNGFQKWIVNELYTFDLPAVEFPIKSIILSAIPHPAYAKAEFLHEGKNYNLLSLAMSDFDTTAQNIRDLLAHHNYHIQPAVNLPLKRLAVQSGLAVYGRNNICYVEGMGSFFSFAAYYSDLPCESDCWSEIRQADICMNCGVCVDNCPTGAIRKERFLIDNERCLSFLNERADAFPEWLPKSVHHCIYDCLRCQLICPMNQKLVNNILGPIHFSEAETEMLLSGSHFDTFSPSFQERAKILGLHQWPAGISRNLKILFELSDGLIFSS